jgi:hypothetical protein
MLDSNQPLPPAATLKFNVNFARWLHVLQVISISIGYAKGYANLGIRLMGQVGDAAGNLECRNSDATAPPAQELSTSLSLIESEASGRKGQEPATPGFSGSASCGKIHA